MQYSLIAIKRRLKENIQNLLGDLGYFEKTENIEVLYAKNEDGKIRITITVDVDVK